MEIAAVVLVSVSMDRGYSGPFNRPGRPTFSGELVLDACGYPATRLIMRPTSAVAASTEAAAKESAVAWVQGVLRGQSCCEEIAASGVSLI
jgi:hypothetical protein